MTKKYSVVYTACIYEDKQTTFDDGMISSGWTSPYDLWPNKIRSQVFNDVNSNCPIIVQIGSNDGISGEYYGLLPFLEELSNFKLFLIEPQKKYITCLKEVYGKFLDKVEYLNFAITENTDTFLLTNRDNCAQIVSENTDSYIDSNEKESVQGISWKDFLKKYNIKKVDILLMDCEGYEKNILNQFKDVGIFPQKIRYEYPHFQNQDDVDNLLKNYGYSIEYCLTDPCWDKVAIFNGESVEYNISPQWKIPKSVL